LTRETAQASEKGRFLKRDFMRWRLLRLGTTSARPNPPLERWEEEEEERRRGFRESGD
jgi:hypothetical protein